MFHYTKAVLKAGLPIVISYFTWMKRYSLHPEKYSIEKRYNKVRKLTKKILNSFNVKIEINGLENIPNSPVCFVSNHQDAFDPLVYISSLDSPTTFLAKAEVMKMPYVKTCVKAISGLFIDRKDLKQSLRTMMKIQEDLAKGDKNWLIFPEGTRIKDNKKLLQEFHHGTFRSPMKAGVPIVPCAIYGSFRTSKLKPQHKTYPVYIEFGKPIFKEDYENLKTEEVAALAQSSVQKMLSFHARAYDNSYMFKNNPKTYKFTSLK